MCKECHKMVEKLKEEVELKAKTVDIYVRKHPYESIGMSAIAVGVVGLWAGYMLGKK